MKSTYKMIGFLAIAGMMLASCEGPMGPVGENGKDGLDGKDANKSCITCHNTVNMDAKEKEYDLSAHFEGNPRTGKYCARCHTNEGFKEITNKPWTPGTLIATTNDVNNGTRFSCETCHKHGSFDFEVDTLAQILRTTSPVSLAYDNYLKTTDFGTMNNLCATCHQIRGARYLTYSDTTLTPDVINKSFTELPYFPFTNTDDNATVKYQAGRSFSVHDGNQSNLFAGINGYEYDGQTYTRTWEHSSFSCTDCHMNQYNPADSTGGHTFKVNKAECNSCHGNTTKITNVQSLIDAKRIELAELLVTRKVFKKTGSGSSASYSAIQTHDFNGKLYPTTQTPGDKFASLATANTVSPTTGLVIYANNITYAADASYATRIGREWKYGELGAAYNYVYINSELSKGVHNPVYALQLLQKSIDWLNAN
jgi:hypothetical protein